MLQKYNKYKLLKIFMDSPTDSFRLRELSRLSKISPPSVMAYLKEFEKQSLIKSYIKRGIPFYKASRENEDFILYKKICIIYELHSSGLIDYLWETLSPVAIILYGSYAKGESIEDSDIDLFILGKEGNTKIEPFEKKFGKTIHLFFEPEINSISKELKNNIINGVILKGYLKVF